MKRSTRSYLLALTLGIFLAGGAAQAQEEEGVLEGEYDAGLYDDQLQ